MDYLNPNSLIQGGGGIYGEVGFGEGVDNGILRTLQAENQMRQANSSNLLSQALTRAQLPNEISKSNLEGARAELMNNPEFLKLFGDKFRGEADSAFAKGAMDRGGLAQKLQNQDTELSIRGKTREQLLKDLLALVQNNPQLSGMAQQLVPHLQTGAFDPEPPRGVIPGGPAQPQGLAPQQMGGTGGVPYPGLMGNPAQLFAALAPFMDSSAGPNSPLSARMAGMAAQADEGVQGKLLETGQTDKRQLLENILTGQFATDRAPLSHPAKDPLDDSYKKVNAITGVVKAIQDKYNKALVNWGNQHGIDSVIASAIRNKPVKSRSKEESAKLAAFDNALNLFEKEMEKELKPYQDAHTSLLRRMVPDLPQGDVQPPTPTMPIPGMAAPTLPQGFKRTGQ